MAHDLDEAAAQLAAQGIQARVVNMATIKPIDTGLVARCAEETDAIVTCEDHNIHGGLGGAVAEFTAAHKPVPVERVGFPGFLPTGSVEWLFREYGLTPEGIEAAARRALARKA